jgi:hypothetical protein
MAGQRRIEKSQTPHSPSPRAPDLAPQRERPLELDADLRPGFRAPMLVQHYSEDAVDAEPGVPEAGVGVGHRARRKLRPFTTVHAVRPVARVQLPN